MLGPLPHACRMLEVTNPGAEDTLGVDFAQIYMKSDMARWGMLSH